MDRRRCHILTVLTALVLSATVIPAGAKEATVRTDEVCFTVHNEGDPSPSMVYGVRYYVGDPRPADKVIVLVHGNSVTGAFWDLRPDFSVARNFAKAGYLVIAYDRLGYRKSPYPRPRGAGYTLTWSSQRAMLHEIVAQVKSGSYTFSNDGTCSTGTGPVVGLSSPTIIVVGHSAGGAIVGGYPGTYHDVAAAVPTGWNNQGFPPEAAAYLAKTWGPEYAKGNDYATLLPTEEDCKRVVLYLPGVAPSLLPAFCRGRFEQAPAGEIAGAPRTYAEPQWDPTRGEPCATEPSPHSLFSLLLELFRSVPRRPPAPPTRETPTAWLSSTSPSHPGSP